MNAQIQAALDPSEGTQSTLVSMVRGRQFPLSFYKNMVGNLQRVSRVATARELITYAQGIYPNNTQLESLRQELDTKLAVEADGKERLTTLAAAATRRNELDRAMAEAVARTSAVPTAKTPTATASPVTVSGQLARVEWTEADFFVHLASLAKDADNAGALQSIRDLRRAKPAWLGARDADLSLEEIRLNGRSGDELALRSVVRRYLTDDRQRGAQMIEVARELHASEHRDAAVLVLRELVAKIPEYRLAQNLLAEWTAKPPAQLMPPAVKVE